MLLRILCILLLAGSALAQTPIDYQKWQTGASEYQSTLGGTIRNYPTGESWAAIENDWITESDTLHTNRRGVLKTDVNDAGQSTITVTWEGATYAVSQRLLKMVWINTATQNWTDIADVTWNTPTVDSNIVSWQGIIPGVDYRVRKNNGRVEHGVFFKPGFLDSAITLYDQRSDSLDIALGNVMAYELTAVDDADSALGTIDRRTLKDFGRYLFQLRQQRLRFPGSDDAPTIPVKQRWVKQNGNIYCVEYVMMRRVKQVHEAYPSATIWHNDEATISDAPGIEDSFIYSSGGGLNYGASVDLAISSSRTTFIRCLGVDVALGVGATISVAICSVYASASTGAEPSGASAYRVLKPWVEGDENGTNNDDGDITYDDWASDQFEWGTAGAANANDGGTDNSGDGTDYDRWATPEDTITFDGDDDGIWFVYTVSNTVAQGWYSGDYIENGIMLKLSSGTGTQTLKSVENGSTEPYFHFTYTVASAATGAIIMVY